jgi:hypothetical protein
MTITSDVARHVVQNKGTMLKITVLLLVSIVLITSCVGSNATLASVMTEEYAIYDAVIESFYLTESIELIVLRDHTVTGAYPRGSLDINLENVQRKLGPAIQSETLNDYKGKNGQTQKLGKRFSLDVQYILLSETEFNEIFDTGEGWSQFYATYPNSQGIMTLSRVGFNAEMDQALVYVGNESDFLGGTGYYVLLARKGDAWVIQTKVVVWIS